MSPTGNSAAGAASGLGFGLLAGLSTLSFPLDVSRPARVLLISDSAVAGALCEMGALSFVAFAVVFCVTTLANMALLSRWSCVQRAGRAFERLGALHRAAVERLMRRDPGTSESSTAEREVPVPYVKTALYAVSAAVALGLVGFLIHWWTA